MSEVLTKPDTHEAEERLRTEGAVEVLEKHCENADAEGSVSVHVFKRHVRQVLTALSEERQKRQEAEALLDKLSSAR